MVLLNLDASNSQHQRAWNMTEGGGLLVGVEAAPLQPTLCATGTPSGDRCFVAPVPPPPAWFRCGQPQVPRTDQPIAKSDPDSETCIHDLRMVHKAAQCPMLHVS